MATRRRRVWARIGRPSTGRSGFGISVVSGRRRVPRPAARTRGRRRSSCQGARLLGVFDLDLPLLANLQVPLHLERTLERETRSRAVGAKTKDFPRRAELVVAIEDPVVLEGPRPLPLRSQFDQAIAQLVQL